MKNGKLPLLVVLLMFFIPLIYLGTVYKSLPESVAIHYGIDGKPNGFGTKTEFLGAVLLTALIAAGTYLLITNLGKIDPKKSAKYSANSLNKVAVAVLIFVTGLNIFIIYSATK